MAMVHLPDELAQRLRAEATRRHMSVDDVAAELLAAQLGADDSLESFLGAGRSGSSEPLDIRAERAAARRLARGA